MAINRQSEPRWDKSSARIFVALVAVLYILVPSLVFAGCKANTALAAVPDRILMLDNITLAPGNLQDFDDTEELPAGSFNEDGYYLSPRFYLFAGDTIKVIITTDAPVELTDDFSITDTAILTGLNSITEENEPSGNIGLIYFNKTQDTTSGAMWQITYLFPSKTLPSGYSVPPGYYQLNIFNASGKEAHCEFSITLVGS
jgi:hypothetical protein